MTANIIYKGNLRTLATHLQSLTAIETDAPTDNQGMGARFSPTDLLATSIGCCMITIMGIKARDMQVDLAGTEIAITKIMKSEPRRVGAVAISFHFPTGLMVDARQQIILENAARHCPVAKSIHPDIELDVTFNWTPELQGLQ